MRGGNFAVPPTVMSLDSWWNTSEPDDANTTSSFSVQSTKDETISSGFLTRTNVGAFVPVYTSLTESTHAPIPSVAVRTASGQLGEKWEETTGPAPAGLGGGGVATTAGGATDRQDTGDPTARHRTGDPRENDHLQAKAVGKEVSLAQQPPPAESKPAVPGSSGAVLGGEAGSKPPGAVLAGRQEPKEEEEGEDGIDPVMLKYMQLVKEKRQGQQTEVVQWCGFGE